MKALLASKERVWRASEMCAALKARGGEPMDRYQDDLDGIERRLLQGMLDPSDEAGLETAYWCAFGKAFEV
jgi:hypothetical protein